jgi:hypothetical protein
MLQARLIIYIFGLWISFWIITTVILVLSPWVRTDIARTDILPAIFSVTGIWIPPLTCLAAFWFPQNEQRVAKLKEVTSDRVYAAIGITAVYLIFVLVLICWSVYFIEANHESPDPGTITLLGQLDQSIKIALVVSPIALAPINWLTGGSSNTRRDRPRRNRANVQD